MKIALCQIREQPHYRRDAFINGLKRAGYNLVPTGRPHSPLDLLIIWNRYGGAGIMADTWERYGGTVLVCENGYIGKDKDNLQLYAISAKGHNGSGWWVHTGEDRFSKLGIELKPFKENTANGHILICGQRGIGTRMMASPSFWHDNVARELKKRTSRPIKIRPHPGNQPAKTPLEQDWDGAHALVIWSSSAGVKAIVNGYPVFYAAPYWICSLAAMRVGDDLEKPNCDVRLRELALFRMAEAQWTVDEIGSGEVFVRYANQIESGAIPA